MSVREIKHPVTGKIFKLGRKPLDETKPLPPQLKLVHKASTVAPPASVDYSADATASLASVMGNDNLGDCAIAAMFHIIGVLTGGAGDEYNAPLTAVTAAYSTICGYVPGEESTDQGCELIPVLTAWQNNGAVPPTHKIAGYVSVDPTNQLQLQTAVSELENLYLGINLPEAYVSPMPSASGFTWDVAGPPVLDNGHCIMVLGYNAQGLLIDTWGMTGILTWAAAAKYLTTAAKGECYTVVSQDAINTGTGNSESGIDWAAMQAAFAALPSVTPSPTPTPAPTPAPPGPAPSAVVLEFEEVYAYLIRRMGPAEIPILIARTQKIAWLSAAQKAEIIAYLNSLS